MSALLQTKAKFIVFLAKMSKLVSCKDSYGDFINAFKIMFKSNDGYFSPFQDFFGKF